MVRRLRLRLFLRAALGLSGSTVPGLSPRAEGQPPPAAAGVAHDGRLPVGRDRDPLVLLERPGPGVIDILPGDRVTTVFRVRNRSTAPVLLHAVLAAPADWQLLTPEPDFTVGPDSTDLRLVSVQSPRAAGAGRYRLLYSLCDEGDVCARDSVHIDVAAQRGMEVQLLQGASVAATDRDYTAVFAVRNAGNVALAVRARAAGPLAGVMRLDSAAWVAPPGSVRPVTVVLAARAAMALRGPHPIGVRVSAAEDSTISASADVVVDFIARSGGARTRSLELPASLAVRVSPGRGRVRGAAELAASGPLRSDGATTLDLSVRTRGLTTNPLFDQDEYRVSVRSRGWAVRGGDQYFIQSPLTEAGQLVFGVSTEATASRLTARLFDVGSRWDFRRGRAQGASLGLRLGDSGSVAVNAISQRGDEAGRAISLGAAVSPAAGTRAQIEVGGGWSGSGQLARGLAWDARAARPWFEVQWSGHETGDGYPARHGRGDEGALFAAVGPDGWRLRFVEIERSLDLSPYRVAYEYNDRDRSIGVQLGTLATIGWHEKDILSHAAGAHVNERSRSARILLYRRLGPMDFQAAGEGGSVVERDHGARRPFHQVSLRTSARARSGAAVSFFVDRNDRHSVAGRPSEAWTSAGGNASVIVGRLGFSLMALNVREGLFSRLRSALFDARVDRWLAAGRRVSMRLRATSFGPLAAERERYVALEFSTPLGIPLVPDRSTGRMIARLYDRETGRGIADALVTLGNERFLTDARGRVAVANLAPGSYRMTVDQETVRDLLVADGAGAPPVMIERGTTSVVDVALARGARVTGRIIVSPGDSSGGEAPVAAARAVGLPNAVVTLRGERHTVRQLTDARGGFSFAGLAPGRWQLTVAEGDLPALHRLERDTTGVLLAPGQDVSLVLRVVPVRRRIRWIGGGDITPPTPVTPPRAIRPPNER
jgi:hypothetical protein